MNALEIRGLSYTYPDGRRALDSVDLVVEEGSRVALIGRNGSGKSTLLLHVMGLLDGGGYLRVCGIERSRRNMKAIRGRTGYLSDQAEYHFIMPDLLNDVMISLPEQMKMDDKRALAERWLDRFGLAAYGGVNPLHLSSGEMKRAALAGILARAPEILLLDEPLGNLDRHAGIEFLELLGSLHNTMIIATHSRHLVNALATHVAVIEKGRIVAHLGRKEAMKLKQVKDLLL